MLSELGIDPTALISLTICIGLVVAIIIFRITRPLRFSERGLDEGTLSEDNETSTKPRIVSTAEIMQTLDAKDDEELDSIDEFEDEDDESLTKSQRNLISKVKLARQKAINKKIEETLTDADRKKEKIMESQQLAKIYSLLRDNQDTFGQMSFNDLKKQMAMYKDLNV